MPYVLIINPLTRTMHADLTYPCKIIITTPGDLREPDHEIDYDDWFEDEW